MDRLQDHEKERISRTKELSGKDAGEVATHAGTFWTRNAIFLPL